jgi:cyclopropane-fatty-acyl-phospholipid synthase
MVPSLSSLPSLPSFIVRPFTRTADVARGTLGSLTWGPALAVAKPAILSVFSRIEVGTLLLVDEPGGTRLVDGQKLNSKILTNGDRPVRRASAIPRVEVVVKNEAFWMRLFLFADMGFAESYMLGEFECEDLTAFFQVSQTPEGGVL